ncbi:MAG: GNAT family N-acetyltransferase [Lachnospiraceae bacterium]|nr:GNAT family N-acetyltransferase [Lachnospiraceae bacterium]
MRIIYEELCIRNAEEADCAQLAKWWNDGSVMAHAGFPRGLGITAEEIREQIKYDSDQTRCRLLIEYKGLAIGEMSYYNRGNHIAEIGIKICETAHQEKGLGKVLLSMLIEELFSMGYEKIILDTNLKNTSVLYR